MYKLINRLAKRRKPLIGTALIVILLIGTGGLAWWSRTSPAQASSATEAEAKARVLENYGKLPLAFEPNRGQTDKSVEYLSRGDGYSLYLSGGAATLALNGKDKETPSRSWLKLNLVSANVAPSAEALDQLEGKANYLIGNDRSQWQTDVPTYRQVKYREVWPGVDMVWYGNQRTLEYDFIVQPGADSNQIELRFEGAKSLRLDDAGNLVLQTSAGELIQHAPVIYQEGAQGREMVTGQYVLNEKREVSFALGAYDASRPLVIDPQLLYATYAGGSLLDIATAVAVDAAGNAYIVGTTLSSDLPVKGALQSQRKDAEGDAFILKLNANGTDTVYCTYLGSRNADTGEDIAVMSNGQACLTGATFTRGTADFPVTDGAFQGNGTFLSCLVGACRGNDAYVTVLNATGNGLVYSSYYGGGNSDAGQAIAVDAANKIYIAGFTLSHNLPTKNGFQNSLGSLALADAFVAVFDPALSGNGSLRYASYVGGSDIEAAPGLGLNVDIATDNAGNAYLGGTTFSEDLPVKSPAGQSLPPLQSNLKGFTDGFVAKIDTEASGAASLTYQTYFGGGDVDTIEAIKVDAQQRVYITGQTFSFASTFPLKNAFRTTLTEGEAYVAKLNADGTALFYCSYLGGDSSEAGLDIALDQAGNTYVAGTTRSGASFLSVNPLTANLAGSSFLAKIEATVSATTTAKLLYSTTFGGADTFAKGVALDSRGNVYLAGVANGNLPVTPGVFQSAFRGAGDGFIAKISATPADTIGVFRPALTDFLLRNSNTAGAPDQTVNFNFVSDALPVTGDWDGDGDDDAGIFRPSVGQFILILRPPVPGCGSPQCQAITRTIVFGQSNDLPIAGDWNGDGIDTPGVFRAGLFLVTNGVNGQNVNGSAPLPDATFAFGVTGDLPVAGDWNGDGFDTVGIFRLGSWLFTNGLADFNPLEAFQVGQFGASDALPLAGDWDGDGVDTFGVFKNDKFTLTNRFQSFRVAEAFTVNFGQVGDLPVAGNWDGKP